MSLEHGHPTDDRLVPYTGLREFGIDYSRQHINRLERARKFPARVQYGENRVAWWASEILEHLAARPRGPLPINPRKHAA